MIRRPPRSTPKPSSAASDVYKRQSFAFPQDAATQFLQEDIGRLLIQAPHHGTGGGEKVHPHYRSPTPTSEGHFYPVLYSPALLFNVPFYQNRQRKQEGRGAGKQPVFKCAPPHNASQLERCNTAPFTSRNHQNAAKRFHGINKHCHKTWDGGMGQSASASNFLLKPPPDVMISQDTLPLMGPGLTKMGFSLVNLPRCYVTGHGITSLPLNSWRGSV